MRAKGYYAVFADGRVIDICHGEAEAMSLQAHLKRCEQQTARKRFKTRLEAEEFAMWWNHRKRTA